jgi:hypothetical protein
VVEDGPEGEDGLVPESTIVWLVHLGAGIPPTEVRGRLHLGEAGLEFTAVPPGVDARIEYAEIRKARRIRGSPVLLVDWQHEGSKRRSAFYFSQPPPLEPVPRSPTIVPPGPLGPFTRSTPSRRQVARMNLGYLRSTSARNRELLREWERAVSERVNGGG